MPSTLRELIVPRRIKNLPDLSNTQIEIVYLRSCRNLESLPELPATLKILDLIGCENLEASPELFAMLKKLQEQHCRISLPDHILGGLTREIKKRFHEAVTKYNETAPLNKTLAISALDSPNQCHTLQIVQRVLTENADLNLNNLQLNRLEALKKLGARAELVMPILELVESDSSHLWWIDEKCKHTSYGCVNQPLKTWSEISAITAIIKSKNIDEFLDGIRFMVAIDMSAQTANEIITRINRGAQVAVELGNVVLRKLHEKLLQDNKIEKPWQGVINKVPFARNIARECKEEDIAKLEDNVFSKSNEELFENARGYITNALIYILKERAQEEYVIKTIKQAEEEITKEKELIPEVLEFFYSHNIAELATKNDEELKSLIAKYVQDEDTEAEKETIAQKILEYKNKIAKYDEIAQSFFATNNKQELSTKQDHEIYGLLTSYFNSRGIEQNSNAIKIVKATLYKAIKDPHNSESHMTYLQAAMELLDENLEQANNNIITKYSLKDLEAVFDKMNAKEQVQNQYNQTSIEQEINSQSENSNNVNVKELKNITNSVLRNLCRSIEQDEHKIAFSAQTLLMMQKYPELYLSQEILDENLNQEIIADTAKFKERYSDINAPVMDIISKIKEFANILKSQYLPNQELLFGVRLDHEQSEAEISDVMKNLIDAAVENINDIAYAISPPEFRLDRGLTAENIIELAQDDIGTRQNRQNSMTAKENATSSKTTNQVAEQQNQNNNQQPATNPEIQNQRTRSFKSLKGNEKDQITIV